MLFFHSQDLFRFFCVWIITPQIYSKIPHWRRSLVLLGCRWQTEGELVTAACSTARLSGSMREREWERAWQRERVPEDHISFSLHQWSGIWPTVGLLHLSYCLPIFLSMLNVSLSLSSTQQATSLHPSHLARIPITLPYSAWVCWCLCLRVRMCVYVRRIISESRCLPK